MIHIKKTYLTVTDHLVSGEQFVLQHDENLDMLITHPQPNKKELPAYYMSDEYISHTDTKRGLLPFLYQTVKSYALSRKVRLIQHLNESQGSVLDIGAGTGDFLLRAKKKGWKVNGVEIHEEARFRSEEKGVVLRESMECLKDETYDVITLWHVLEHLPNLDETITQLSKLLRPGGHLVVAVPNFKSYDADYYKSFWAAYDVPRHLWHFSQSSMKQLFLPLFKLKACKPMWFDAFYVSLLSEKYKTGNKFSFHAFWIGLYSNVKALRTSEYSSIIYCFEKR